MATEKLKFVVELYATYWQNPPIAEILINNDSKFKGEITTDKENPTRIEFEQEFEDGQPFDIIIDRTNKGKYDTIVNAKGDILHDQILHIKYMEVDEIDLGSVLYEGVYTPAYPEPWATQQRDKGIDLPESQKNNTILGHNGVWKLSATSPLYMWLLENLY